MATHQFHNTCAQGASFDIDDEGKLRNIHIHGGCPGNTVGVAMLAEGRDAREMAALLRGIPCGNKPTSCPDQLSRAIEAELASRAAAGNIALA